MEPKRRAALLERRQKLRQEINLDQQLTGLEDLRAALADAGEAFDILYRGEVPPWGPNWIPRGYSRIPWNLVPAAEDTWFKDDVAARDHAFVSALSRLANADEKLLLVFEGYAASFRTTRAVAERHVAAILKDRVTRLSPLWVTSPPKQWLVEVSSDTVRVGDAMAAATNDRGTDAVAREAFDALRKALDESGSAYVAFHHDDPERPELPNIHYERPIPPLRMTVPAADDRLVRSTVLGFLEKRVSLDDPVQLILTGAPRLQFSHSAFEPLFEALYASAADFNVSGPGAPWVIGVRHRSQTWIEAIG